MIRQVQDPKEKGKIAQTVLTQLPEWFGLPESVENYIRDCQDMPFWAVFVAAAPAGFLALKATSNFTAEVYVMGVLPQYHRMGLGSRLYEALEQFAREQGFRYIQIKTVKMGCYPSYDKTNRFYRAMGFSELECFPQLWDEWNPCQIYVKYIGG